MKDYSNLIPTSYGFITKYEIVGDEIHIYTVETKKGEPHKYPLNEEWLSKIEKRLENQYQLIVENRDIVKKVKVRNYISKIALPMNISGTACAITAISLAVNGTWLCIPTLIAAFYLVFSKRTFIKKYAKKIDAEMDIIEAYLINREEIEELSQTDPNITAYLSKSATKKLKANQSLKENGTINRTFNADFMDKTNNKDLTKLLERYIISKSLLEEQTFVNPLEETNLKRKTRKKEENK